MTPHPDTGTCIEQVERMTDYLEGAMPTAEARRLERHLETCPGCSEYLHQLRTIAGSLGGLAEDSIAAETRAALLAAFRDLRNA